MSHEKLINKVVDEVLSQGYRLSKGDTVAHKDHELTYEFIAYEGDIAICLDVTTDTIIRLPASEVFDSNIVSRKCVDRVFREQHQATTSAPPA